MGLLRQDPTVCCMQSALLVFPHHLQQIKHSCVMVESTVLCFSQSQVCVMHRQSDTAVLSDQIRRALYL